MATAETARGRLVPLAEEDTLSLGERAYRRLRESIVQGVIPAGRKISERSIAIELGISAQPVREALRRLEQDGIVVTLPRRGTVVAEMGPAQLGELGAAALGQTGREALVGKVLKDYVPDRDVGAIAGTSSVGAGMMLGVVPLPNDGTIAVAETQAPWLKDHLSYPVTHTGFLVSPEVASQTAFFLRHGMLNRQSPVYKNASPIAPA